MRYAILACVLLAGCAATESTRRVNIHNRLAADFISGVSENPQIDEAALLISAGTVVLEAELGSPENVPLKYDPLSQKEDIEKAKKEIEDKAGLIDGVWNFLGTTAGKVSAALGFGTLGLTIFGWARTALWSGKLWKFAKTAGSVIEKLPDVKLKIAAKAAEKGDAKAVDTVVEAMP